MRTLFSLNSSPGSRGANRAARLAARPRLATPVATLVAVVALTAASPAVAQESPAQGQPAAATNTGTDTIDLKSGGLLRGTIIEAIPNSHARIQLATGEVAKVPWSDIARIERAPRPASNPPAPPPPAAAAPAAPGPIVATMPGKAPQGSPPVWVHIDGSEADRLEVKAAGDQDEWSPVCTTPCDRPVPAGYSYRIAGDSIRTSSPFTIDPQQGGRQTLVVSEASRGAFVLGIVGMGVGAGGIVVGLSVAFVGAVGAGLSEHGTSAYQSDRNIETAGWVVTGIGAAAVAGGLVLLLTNVRTGVSQGPTTSQGASAAPPRVSTSLPPAPFATSGERLRDPMAAAMPPVVGFPVFGATF
jgi:hypothetical protein